MKRLPLTGIIFTALLLTLLGGGPPYTPAVVTPALAQAGAADDPKISDDLEEWVAANPQEKHVEVIITTPDTPTDDLVKWLNKGKDIKLKKKLVHLPIITLKLPVELLAECAARPDVTYVSLDRETRRQGHLAITTGASLVRNMGTAETGNINGRGVGIAVLDSGVSPKHHAFSEERSNGTLGNSRIVAKFSTVTGDSNTDDPYGHGTHVAAMAAGNGHVARGAYRGVAPAANIVNVRVLNSGGTGKSSDALAGVDWVIANRAAYNVRVMNLSLGATAVDSYRNDPLCLAVRRAVNAGIVVVVAAGNVGKDGEGNKAYGGIHSPGIEPSAVTVGAANTFGTNSRADDAVASYSSRGPTRGFATDAHGNRRYDNLIKPDLVAPGNKMIQAESSNDANVSTSRLMADNPSLDVTAAGERHDEHGLMYMSGTSVAAPAVAGAAALLLQRNPTLTPNLVKAVLQLTAQPLANHNTLEQGAGLLNVEGAVRLAAAVRADLTDATAVGEPLLTASAAPAQSSTIAGVAFQWGGGIIQRHTFITGPSLLTKFQGIYRTSTYADSTHPAGVLLTDGVLMSDGTMMSDGVLIADGVLMSDGVQIADGVLMSDGTVLSSGTPVTNGEALRLANGVLLADGVLLSDGVMMADGVVMSDGALGLSTAAQAAALSALTEGDPTTAMEPSEDFTDDAPAEPRTRGRW